MDATRASAAVGEAGFRAVIFDRHHNRPEAAVWKRLLDKPARLGLGLGSTVRLCLPSRGLARPNSYLTLTILELGTHVNCDELSEGLDLEGSQALALTGDCVEIFLSRRSMPESQTRSALSSHRLITGAVRVQDMHKRHFTCLTIFHAKNSHRLAISASLHHYGYKPFPYGFVVSPVLAGVFRQDPHRPMF